MKNFFQRNAIQLFTIFIIAVLSVVRIISEEKPYAAGDGVEYSLMTEALFNHFSPNVEVKDCESFKSAYTKINNWEYNDKGITYDETEGYIADNTLKPLDHDFAYFVDKDLKKYSVHFFVYSIANIPMRWICSIWPFDPLRVFQFTNMLLIIISCSIFLFYSKFEKFATAVFALLFFYSTNYWYFCWVHPEIFTVCFVSVGLWLFFHEKHYTGILLISIAALQNQPISILVAVLCLVVLFKKGFNLKNITRIGLSSFLIFMPSLFYYYHFGVTNLINYQWPLDPNNVTATRVFGFFFDLNQGMILAFPFILLVYIYLIVRKLILIRSSTVKWDALIPFVVLIMTMIVSGIIVWNMGQAVVNRYVSFMGGIILVHFFVLLMQVERKIIRNTILVIALSTQIATALYFNTMNTFDWSSNTPKPIANWVFDNYPKLYNPDPIIFIERYAHGMIAELNTSPAFYRKADGTITKIMVHKMYLGNLEKFGISKEKIDSLRARLKYTIDWAYIDIDDGFKPVLSDEGKVELKIKEIKNSTEWYELIKQKAVTQGISETEALRRDAAFNLGIDYQKLEAAFGASDQKKETTNEKVQKKINEIKADAKWLRIMEDKAKERRVPLDTVLHDDALWMVQEAEGSK